MTRTETLEQFLVRETGGRSVIEVLYPQRGVEVPCLRCASEIGQVLIEIFGRWPGMS